MNLRDFFPEIHENFFVTTKNIFRQTKRFKKKSFQTKKNTEFHPLFYLFSPEIEAPPERNSEGEGRPNKVRPVDGNWQVDSQEPYDGMWTRTRCLLSQNPPWSAVSLREEMVGSTAILQMQNAPDTSQSLPKKYGTGRKWVSRKKNCWWKMWTTLFHVAQDFFVSIFLSHGDFGESHIFLVNLGVYLKHSGFVE